MSLMETPPAEIGWKAADFNLPGVDGKTYNLVNSRGKNGLLVMFICNHCPYVKAVMDKILRDTAELKQHGINTIAISSNDVVQYPDDDFEHMKILATEKNFSFPYVFDESQEVARAYDAVCTPEFYGFNADLTLQYRGRIDESKREGVPAAKRELFEAMIEVAQTGKTTVKQYNSIGCNIKWAV